MQLAYNSNGWRSFPITTAIRQLSEIGYSGIELSCQPDQLFPIGFSKDEAKRIRQAAQEAGIAISNVHAGDRNLLGPDALPCLISPEPEGRARRIQANQGAIDLCAELGAEIMVVTSGPLHRNMTIADAWRHLVDGLGECIDYAQRAGVFLLVEPEPELFIRSTFDFLTLAKALGHPRGFGLNLDVGHSHCLFENTPDVIRETSDLLMHIHVEDIAKREHKHLMPGDGDINFSAIQDALQGIGYSRYVSVELFDHFHDPGQAARRAREFLSSWTAAAPCVGTGME
jgi:sugar phosphate isomerase/epimerase